MPCSFLWPVDVVRHPSTVMTWRTLPGRKHRVHLTRTWTTTTHEILSRWRSLDHSGASGRSLFQPQRRKGVCLVVGELQPMKRPARGGPRVAPSDVGSQDNQADEHEHRTPYQEGPAAKIRCEPANHRSADRLRGTVRCHHVGLPRDGAGGVCEALPSCGRMPARTRRRPRPGIPRRTARGSSSSYSSSAAASPRPSE